MVILENIDIDKAILQNIDIDKISNLFKFGISNRATAAAHIAFLHKDLWFSVHNIWKIVITITLKTLFWVFTLLASLSPRNQNWLHVTVFPNPEVHHSHFALLHKGL